MVQSILDDEKQFSIVTAVKKPVKNRYFIELHVPETPDTSRVVQDEVRRHNALEFVQILREWARDNSMEDEIGSLSTTVMGQVMIVCTHKVIDFIREQDVWAIAHIRSSAQAGDLRSISGKI